MRMRPESLTEYVCNVRWAIGVPLQLMEEGVRGPQDSGTGAPGMREAMECIHRARKRGDRKAEDAAFVDYTRADVWEWWQDFPDRRLLTDLSQRTARRREGDGSPDSRRPPVSSGGPPGCQANAGRCRGHRPIRR